MPTYQYEAEHTETVGEEYTESGTIRANDEADATAKLNEYGFSRIRLKQVRGLAALWKWFMVDIK